MELHHVPSHRKFSCHQSSCLCATYTEICNFFLGYVFSCFDHFLLWFLKKNKNKKHLSSLQVYVKNWGGSLRNWGRVVTPQNSPGTVIWDSKWEYLLISLTKNCFDWEQKLFLTMGLSLPVCNNSWASPLRIPLSNGNPQKWQRM